MRAVLGIDAAWTAGQPSGVAVARETKNGWELVAAAPSYQRFHALTTDDAQRDRRPMGSQPCAHELLAAARSLCGQPVDLVAVDMPLSRQPITGRRVSDNAVSKAYGGRKCGTHTPSTIRPGQISDKMREDFEREGYKLLTTAICPPGLIEVYPHPALVELAMAPERLKYKAVKSRAYWPTLTPLERRGELQLEWARIVTLLEGEITGVASAFEGFPTGMSGIEMKATEDMLDAVVCVWVAICALQGQAVPFGDAESAIWIPTPVEVAGESA